MTELESEINRRVELEINPSISIGVLLPNGCTKFYGYGYFNDQNNYPDSLTPYGQGNYSISNQLSDIMVEVLPEDWEVHDIKGQNLEQLEDYNNAITAYEKALSLNPENELLKEKIKRCTTMYKQ